MGLVSSSVDWKSAYIKAFSLLKPNGIVIGRNYNHKKYGPIIKNVITQYNLIDQAKGSFVINV